MGNRSELASRAGSALAAGMDRIFETLKATLPSAFSAFVALAIGALAAFVAGRVAEAIARNAAVPNVHAVGRTFRGIVAGIAILVALDKLGLGRSLLGIFFLIAVAAVALAFAIAFGLGAVALARRLEEEGRGEVGAGEAGEGRGEEK